MGFLLMVNGKHHVTINMAYIRIRHGLGFDYDNKIDMFKIDTHIYANKTYRNINTMWLKQCHKTIPQSSPFLWVEKEKTFPEF